MLNRFEAKRVQLIGCFFKNIYLFCRKFIASRFVPIRNSVKRVKTKTKIFNLLLPVRTGNYFFADHEPEENPPLPVEPNPPRPELGLLLGVPMRARLGDT